MKYVTTSLCADKSFQLIYSSHFCKIFEYYVTPSYNRLLMSFQNIE